MSVLGQENSMADSVGNDAKQAINMGKEAAKTAKNLGKAATHAATGNFAGAAVDILKDPKLIAMILIPIVLFFLVVVCFLYAIPTAIYESIVTFTENIKEHWEEIYYSNEYGGSFFSILMSSMEVGKELFADIADGVKTTLNKCWNAAKSLFVPSDKDSDLNKIAHNNTDEGSDFDFGIVTQEAVERVAVIRKCIAANEKYRIRAEQVRDGVKSCNSDIREYVQKTIKAQLETGSDYNMLQTYLYISTPGLVENIVPMGTDSTGEIGSDGVRKTNKEIISYLEQLAVDIQNAPYNSRDEAKEKFDKAVKDYFPMVKEDGGNNSNSMMILSLLATQQGSSIEDMQTSDFMRYLGYYEGNVNSGRTTEFNVGHIDDDPIIAKVKTWKGTFMPQYLMEEINYYRNQKMYAESLGILTDDEAEEYENIINSYSDYGAPLIDFLVVLQFPDLDLIKEPSENRVVIETRNNEDHHLIYFKYKDIYTDEENGGAIELEVTKEWDDDGTLISVIVTPSIHYSISPRDASSILSIIGIKAPAQAITDSVVSTFNYAPGHVFNDIPEEATSFKTYESYTAFGTNTKQHELQQSATTDDLGFRRYRYNGEDYYMVALGSHYMGYECGKRFEITFTDNNTGEIKTIKAIAGDQKADQHTDPENKYAVTNGDVVEFIVDVNALDRTAKGMGDMSYAGSVIDENGNYDFRDAVCNGRVTSIKYLGTV